MAWVIVLGILVFVAGGIFGYWRYSNAANPDRFLKAMEGVAQKINGRVVDGPALTFSRAGYPATVTMSGELTRITEIRYAIAGEIPNWLAVSTESLGDEMARQLGFNDLQVGDFDFDSCFHVQAGDAGFALKHLRGELKMLLRQIARRHSFSFRISPKWVKFRYFRHVTDPGELETVVSWSMQIFDMLEIAPAGQVVLSEVSRDIGLESLCEVCGTSLSKGSVVRCAACDTPHHRDCWEFNQERCATFACGGREAR